jgi:hypothetical protein
VNMHMHVSARAPAGAGDRSHRIAEYVGQVFQKSATRSAAAPSSGNNPGMPIGDTRGTQTGAGNARSESTSRAPPGRLRNPSTTQIRGFQHWIGSKEGSSVPGSHFLAADFDLGGPWPRTR